jgi:quercetin dioxygenase-like cupin family protein
MRTRLVVVAACTGVFAGALLAYGAPKLFSGDAAYGTPGVNFNSTVLGRGTVGGFVFGKPTTTTVTRKVTIRTKAGVFSKRVRFKVPSLDMAIDCTNGCDLAFQQATVPPGGSSGWHTHPGATFVGIGQGEITYYHGDSAACHSEKVSAGSGFGQMPNEVHLGRNESSNPLVIYTMYVLPTGTPNSGIRIDQPQPAGCPDVH